MLRNTSLTLLAAFDDHNDERCHLANTTEWSELGGDAACRYNYSNNLFDIAHSCLLLSRELYDDYT